MRKTTSIASRLTGSSNIAENFSSSSQFLLSFSTETSLPHQCHDEQLHNRRVFQLLQDFSEVRSPQTIKSLHGLNITTGSQSTQTVYLYNNIISAYAALGDICTAHQVFDSMRQRNVISYNTLISAYSKNGDVDEAWELFSDMRSCGFQPTQHTFCGLLSCPSLDLHHGNYMHGSMIKAGLLCADAFGGTSLLGFYGRHGCPDEAVLVFQDMPIKNLITWNSMITLLGKQGLTEESSIMFRELIRTEGAVSEYSLLGVLSGLCIEQDLTTGEQIHGLAIKKGLYFVVSVANSLINMYSKCSDIYFAEKVFAEVPLHDIVSWNSIISALSKCERPSKAMELFLKMQLNGVLPNQTTFASIINSCVHLKVLLYGEFIHAKVIRNFLQSDAFIGSCLVDFYAKCGRLEDAHCCFDEIYEKNLVSWNALMFGYSNKGYSHSVFLLRQMVQLGYRPNEVSFSTAVRSSLIIELQQLHSLIMKMGYLGNDFVLSSLLSTYAKHGLLCDALNISAASNAMLSVVPYNVIAGIYNRLGKYHKTQDIFSLLEEPDTVSWNILIAACSRNGDCNEAFELFECMHRNQICIDNYTVVSLFSICANQCNLALGCSLHGLVIKTNFSRCDTFVFNVIINMYGKCGSLESAMKIFNEVTHKNVITWTALVSALGLHGHAHEALQRFREMEIYGIKPDRVAFIAVLSACRHVGLVEEGMEMFEQMKSKYGVEPEMDHYLVVVDLLARHGRLKEAEQLIVSMPFPPNALVWRSFLESCKNQSKIRG